MLECDKGRRFLDINGSPSAWVVASKSNGQLGQLSISNYKRVVARAHCIGIEGLIVPYGEFLAGFET